MAMSSTKSILPKTVSFVARLLHYEERAKSYAENLPNFTHPLVSNIEAVNDTLTVNKASSQPYRIKFV